MIIAPRLHAVCTTSVMLEKVPVSDWSPIVVQQKGDGGVTNCLSQNFFISLSRGLQENFADFLQSKPKKINWSVPKRLKSREESCGPYGDGCYETLQQVDF